MTPRPRAILAAAVAAAVSAAAVAAATAPLDATTRADVRRLLSVLTGIQQEYAEAHDEHGRIVRPIEIEEAKLLVADGRDLVRRLGGHVPADAGAALDRIEAALAAGAPPEALAEEASDLARRIVEATGVSPARPRSAPSVARGRALFAENCAGCHGERGAGDGPEAASLQVKPANFTDPEFMRGETPLDFFTVISLGRRKSGMPAWDESLGVQARWDLVAYLWTLPGTAVDAGVDAYRSACASCHGPALEGGGTVPPLADPLALADRTEDQLVRVLDDEVHRAVPAVAALSAESRRRIATWVRHASLRSEPLEPGEAEPAQASAELRGLAEAERLLLASRAAAARDRAAAAELATQAYIAFEPFEPRLRVRRPELVARVEERFVAYRMALRGGADPAQVAALADAAAGALGEAGAVLRGAVRVGPWTAFGQALAIVVREGAEIILIVGALLTWVRRRGSAALVRPIHAGVALGVVASLATAAALTMTLERLPWASEAIEGGAMLIAAAVLFWVSYWLISKAEADRWQRFIRDQVETALGRGSRVALASAAFLAVYREGFETVLFYQALMAGGASAGPVAAGFAAGAVLLGVLYAAMRWFGMRLPIRPFFLVTGGLLYGLAIAFAGRGVAELQEAGLVPMTPVPGVPAVPALGLFPTVETLSAQGVLVVLLAFAVAVTVRRRLRTAAATVAVMLVLGLAPGARAAAAPVAAEREWVMATAAEIRIYDVAEPRAALLALDAAMAELRAVDRLMAVQRAESDVSRLNREAAAGWVRVDRRVVEVLAAARTVSRLTDGAFDVTVLPVVAAWGFLDGPGRRPGVRPPLPAGWRQVRLDPRGSAVRYAGAGVGVDLGGIAKGYALDRARTILLRHGVRSAWLDLGGSTIATLGRPPDAPRWRVAVRDPRRPGALAGVVEIGEAAVSTSSDAERFVQDAHGRAGHVIDPTTGAPARGLRAATVVAASATLADALSTAAVVLGAARVRPVLARTGGQAVLLGAGTDGESRWEVTPGLRFRPAPPPRDGRADSALIAGPHP